MIARGFEGRALEVTVREWEMVVEREKQRKKGTGWEKERRKGKGKTGVDTNASEKDSATEERLVETTKKEENTSGGLVKGKDDVEEHLGGGSESKVQAQDDGKRGRTLYPSLILPFTPETEKILYARILDGFFAYRPYSHHR